LETKPEESFRDASNCFQGIAGFARHFPFWLALYPFPQARAEDVAYVKEENTQSKGTIRRSFVFDALPCQPHCGLAQKISSFPKVFIASISDREGFEHLRCKLILWPLLGQAKTI
jgi:hypothetical protein